MSTPSRRVLVVAFRFPPHGGGGVQRVAYFVRHLRESGWEPVVLTGPPRDTHVVEDRDLLDLLPEGVQVVRTGYFDTRPLFRFLGKLHLARLVRALTPSFPNLQAGWIGPGLWSGWRLIKNERIDVIFSSAYPMSSHLVACGLASRSGIPWVADYRDEWSLRAVMSWPTPVHRLAARWLDRRVMARADRVTTTSPAHTDRFVRELVPDRRHRFVTITNGFDPGDFEGIRERLTDVGNRDRMLISHVGSMFEWRNADTFLDCVDDLVACRAIDPERIRVRFVGHGPTRVPKALERHGIVSHSGYVSHRDAVRDMCSADLLLLINSESTNTPGKTFEYVASGRPILALVRPGPTVDVIEETRSGRVIDIEDSESIRSAVLDLYLTWQRGELRVAQNRRVLMRYSRQATAKLLGHVLDDLSDPREGLLPKIESGGCPA